MEIVSASDLKQRLGEYLDRASLRRLAIERHGRVVAFLVPAREPRALRDGRRRLPAAGLTRGEEERLLKLVAGGDLRPSRWRRAGDAERMAGLAALLASAGWGERERLFALSEQLHSGMSTVEGFGRWLAGSRIEPGRLLSMLNARLAGRPRRTR
jgi:antitoxin (DNA-binding transcriptional repressor) of toxin-antitoxin stability system